MPSSSLNLADLDGSNGFVITNQNNDDYDSSSLTTSSAGDINGDGFTDLWVRLESSFIPDRFKDDVFSGYYRVQAQSAYVVFGSPNIGTSGSIDLSTLDGNNGFRLDGTFYTQDYTNDINLSAITDRDINGDGIADLIISAPGTDLYSTNDAGSTYVLFGATDIGVGGSIDPSTLDGTNGLVINGTNSGDYIGTSITTTSDLNGDGIADLIIGVFNAETNGIRNAGSISVVFGGTNIGAGGSIDPSTLDGTNGLVINATTQSDFLRASVITDSDINGDGIADLIISAPYAEANGIRGAGSISVVFGGTNVGAGGSIDRSTLDGSNGFVINGTTQGDFLRASITTTSDLNGDGIADLIIHNPNADANGIANAGSIYVLFGGTNVGAGGSIDRSTLDGSNGFVIDGTNQNDLLLTPVRDFSGPPVITTSDLNGDGIADLIIHNPYANPNGILDAGSTSVVFGGTNIGAGGSIDRSTLDGSNGFVINGTTRYNGFSSSVITDSDLNNDGVADLIIGVPNAEANGIPRAGSIYVLFGGTNIGAGGSLDRSTLDGSNGFVIDGTTQDDFLRASITTNSDLNGDGIADLIIGAPYADPNRISNAGSISVVFGGANMGAGGSIDPSTLDGSNGFVINGTNQNDRLGRSVTTTSDINGDGITDLIFGVPSADPNDINSAGSTYVVFGGTNMGAGGTLNLSDLDGSNGFVINGFVADEKSGSSIKGLGDINGDGIDDVIISTNNYFNYYDDPGNITVSNYVVFGSVTSVADPTVDDDELLGTNAGELIRGLGGDDLINGSNGNDTLLGNGGNDTLIGGNGDDLLFGGWGNDLLVGGVGSDIFLLTANFGSDTVTDFESGVDSLVLFAGLTFEQLSITQNNDDTLIGVSYTGKLLATLTGVSANLITAADFG